MDELVRWLGEQFDEDERIARAAPPGPWLGTDAEDVGAWSVYDPEWLIASATVYTHNQPMGGKRGPGYIDASATTAHIAEWDPARVLAEIDAKRDLLVFAKGIHDHHETFTTGVYARLEKTLRLYALAYKERPGYREEWRP
ncbi:DUF6221 family protein [Streptomyces canus]|uniref:DUF6221 family protein n=1 Tax=Streptomyces canus TaxID=58343 RepID=UPI00036E2F8E|nr:DUF6221 family protein [Streptomyces canus]